ncbi:hypothetical protein BUALT_Bualt04G0113200 [Buddleja alternifolia]|uniref:Protein DETOXIFICATION n=1 Tax=Buddleja alternifolia TaxID=168488 RepID=A0AAV6XUV0_9LAMI|nr:hypothetical protein BUALT_Bualt04G0113200 [Buddleja alternifolia]
MSNPVVFLAVDTGRGGGIGGSVVIVEALWWCSMECDGVAVVVDRVIIEIKMLYAIALPMIITGLLIYGKSLISMLFLGYLGKDALAGGSLAIGIANITGYSVISGLAMGMEAISSQAFGAKQWPLMCQTLKRTVIILLFACIPVSISWLNIQPLLVIFNQDPQISAVASTYLTFCLPDLVFQALINPLKIYLRSQNVTLPLMCAAGFALVLHAPINYFLVEFLKLGVRGIAVAVTVTDFIFLVTLIVYLCFSSGTNVQKSWLCNWGIIQCFDHEWRSILNLSLPSCISVCLEWWWYELMILLSGILPNAAVSVATMGILIQATSLVYIFPSALSLAASTRVGNELGANQPSKAKTSSYVALFCAVLTSFIATCLMALFGGAWGRAFTEDEAIVALAAAVMPVVGLCELGNCPQTAGCGVLRGSARPSLGVHINLGSFYGVGLPLAVFMGFGLKMGLLGLWLGLFGAQIVCAVLMVWVLRRTDWVGQAKRARELIGMEINDEEPAQQK